MSGETLRFNLQMSQELSQVVDQIAESAGSNRTDVFRQALALMQIAHTAKKEGRHIGLVSDRSKLDTEIIGLL
jgi:metal-responsive CopG/Arc/MetJ family transcriptional regulator